MGYKACAFLAVVLMCLVDYTHAWPCSASMTYENIRALLGDDEYRVTNENEKWTQLHDRIQCYLLSIQLYPFKASDYLALARLWAENTPYRNCSLAISAMDKAILCSKERNTTIELLSVAASLFSRQACNDIVKHTMSCYTLATMAVNDIVPACELNVKQIQQFLARTNRRTKQFLADGMLEEIWPTVVDESRWLWPNDQQYGINLNTTTTTMVPTAEATTEGVTAAATETANIDPSATKHGSEEIDQYCSDLWKAVQGESNGDDDVHANQEKFFEQVLTRCSYLPRLRQWVLRNIQHSSHPLIASWMLAREQPDSFDHWHTFKNKREDRFDLSNFRVDTETLDQFLSNESWSGIGSKELHSQQITFFTSIMGHATIQRLASRCPLPLHHLPDVLSAWQLAQQSKDPSWPYRRLRLGIIVPHISPGYNVLHKSSEMLRHMYEQNRADIFIFVPGLPVPNRQRVFFAYVHIVYLPQEDLLASQSLLRHYELDALWWFLSWDTSRERAFEFLHQRVALSQILYRGYVAHFDCLKIDYRVLDVGLIPSANESTKDIDDMYPNTAAMVVGTASMGCSYCRPESLPPPPAGPCHLMESTNDNSDIDRDHSNSGRIGTEAKSGRSPPVVRYCVTQFASRIHPKMFLVWARILDAVPNAVLRFEGTGVSDNILSYLKTTLFRAGIHPARVHLHRKRPFFRSVYDYHSFLHRQCDIVLDNAPGYAMQSSAVDAIAAGVPVYTYPGTYWQERVASALQQMINITHPVASSWGELVDRAVEVGKNRTLLCHIKQQMQSRASREWLFDEERLASSFSTLLQLSTVHASIPRRRENQDPHRPHLHHTPQLQSLMRWYQQCPFSALIPSSRWNHYSPAPNFCLLVAADTEAKLHGVLHEARQHGIPVLMANSAVVRQNPCPTTLKQYNQPEACSSKNSERSSRNNRDNSFTDPSGFTLCPASPVENGMVPGTKNAHELVQHTIQRDFGANSSCAGDGNCVSYTQRCGVGLSHSSHRFVSSLSDLYYYTRIRLIHCIVMVGWQRELHEEHPFSPLSLYRDGFRLYVDRYVAMAGKTGILYNVLFFFVSCRERPPFISHKSSEQYTLERTERMIFVTDEPLKQLHPEGHNNHRSSTTSILHRLLQGTMHNRPHAFISVKIKGKDDLLDHHCIYAKVTNSPATSP